MKIPYKIMTTAAIAVALSSIQMISAQAAVGDFYNQTTQTKYTKAALAASATLADGLNDQMIAGNVILKEYNTGKYIDYAKANTSFLGDIADGVDASTATLSAVVAGKTDATTAVLEAYKDSAVTTALSVSSVSAITPTTVTVEFTALPAAKTGATIDVKDNTGATVAVVAQDFQAGETGATFVLATPRLTAPTGAWTVNGVSFNADAPAQLLAINTAAAANNEISTLAALKTAGLVNIIDANITSYVTAITAPNTIPTTLVEVQTAITAANKTATSTASDAIVVKAVADAKSQTTLLAALQNPAFARVNPDWIMSYVAGATGTTPGFDLAGKGFIAAGVGSFDGTVATPATNTIASVQAVIDAVNTANMPTVASLTTVALANAKVALQQKYIIADVAPLHAKADAIKATQTIAAVLAVKEATTPASVYNALVALSALDSTVATGIPATTLNANLKVQYAAVVRTGFTSATTIAQVKTAVEVPADAAGLNLATAAINALTATSTDAQITSALQTLANVTSHLGAAKFDMSTVKTASLKVYVTDAAGFVAVPVVTVANVNSAISTVNAVANQAVYLNTIKTSNSVSDVKDALTSLAVATPNTTTTAYVNASSAVKLEVAQFIIDNQATIVTTTSATITDYVAVTLPAVPSYATNALEAAIASQTAKVTSFNGIGNLATAGTPSITKTNTALTAYAYAPYIALTDAQKLAVAENINGLTKTVATVVTPLDFTSATGADAVKTIAQANAIIDAAIAAIK
ncbi:hypothetical protein K2F43_17020 [Clostridium estertheticum]|uniref:hypothetical protein n=1 Tax=Clostridium estertheticum TaxID=238834 RepID=UPI001C6E60E0|nr:hypothetical protein [Clostridium estertheticum]MBW9172910.1 hypothetical protein [Clostridium estertheticum]WLC75250.1 hypothetical protein KTC99_21480 [Clostridium estertheticum]